MLSMIRHTNINVDQKELQFKQKDDKHYFELLLIYRNNLGWWLALLCLGQHSSMVRGHGCPCHITFSSRNSSTQCQISLHMPHKSLIFISNDTDVVYIDHPQEITQIWQIIEIEEATRSVETLPSDVGIKLQSSEHM